MSPLPSRPDAPTDLREVAAQAFRERLAPLFEAAAPWPNATEVLVDGDEVRVDTGDHMVQLEPGKLRGVVEHHIRAAIDAAAVFAGVEFGSTGTALPILSVKLPPDLRVSCSVPPASNRLHLAIRFLRARDLSLDDYIAQQVISTPQADQLRELLAHRKNVLVSGGTSTGKTTFLNALLKEIPLEERLILIEDTPEVVIDHANAVSLLAVRGETGEARVSADDLVQASLRMRPDRIILGELRGREAASFLRAVNTGHPGSITTVHADSPRGAVDQLSLLVMQAGLNMGRAEIADYVRGIVDVFVQLSRRDGRRAVSQITFRGD